MSKPNTGMGDFGAPFDDSSGRLVSRNGRLARWIRRWVRMRYLDRIERNVAAGARLLEFGCGGGNARLAATYKVTGLEIAGNAAQAARKLYPSVLKADVCAIPVADGIFDAAASIFVLEHLRLTAAENALRELYRVLIPGGKLICVCDLECDHLLLSWARRNYPEGYQQAYVDLPGHHGLRRESQWQDLLKGAGFETREWLLQSRFPILDHCPWIQLSLSSHFPAWTRAIGRAAHRAASVPNAGALWCLGITWADALLAPALPDRWAYRLLFVAQKPFKRS